MNAPQFLSFEFHIRYFPWVLWGRLRSSERAGMGFTSTLEHHISLAFCLILIAVGLPSATSSGSILGWIATGIGVAGTVALVINSIVARLGTPPAFDEFLAGVFFFCVFLGISGGVFIGTLEHSLLLGLLSGCAGLVAGYLLGILAGLWFQYLGWLATLVNTLASLAVLGMFVVDIVLLAGALD